MSKKYKLFILFIIMFFLTACSNNNNIYYNLPINLNNSNLISKTEEKDLITYKENEDILFLKNFNFDKLNKKIWIKKIYVSDFLSSNGLVYQTNDVQYIITNNNLWISSLEDQLIKLLSINLKDKLPNWFISTQQIQNNNDDFFIISAIITGFHGRYDGKVIIQGSWLIEYKDKSFNKSFNLILSQKEDGYDSLVRTLSEGWKIINYKLSLLFDNIK